MLNITLFMKPIHNERTHLNRMRKGFSINPYDLFALKAICKIKSQEETMVSVISMGPLGALNTLTRCLYYNADNCYLISDQNLSFSDTLKTGHVLSFAAKKFGLSDYYFFGNKSIDGETGQVGIAFSTIMKLPIVLNVTHILNISATGICLQNKYGENILAPLHSVIVMDKEDNNDYLTFYNMKKKVGKPIVYSLKDINYFNKKNDIKTKVVQMEDQLKIKSCVIWSKEESTINICNLIRG